jgi:hypothetical protein
MSPSGDVPFHDAAKKPAGAMEADELPARRKAVELMPESGEFGTRNSVWRSVLRQPTAPQNAVLALIRRHRVPRRHSP